MTQQDYQELKAEVKKTMMAELFKKKDKLVNYEQDIYHYTFDRAYALGAAIFKQESDGYWHKNMAKTLKTLKEAQTEFGVSEEYVTAAANWVKDVSYNAVQGIIKPETISLVIKVTKLRSDVSDQGTTCTPAVDAPSTKSNAPSAKLFHGLVDAENATTTEPTDLNKSSETCTDNCSSQNHFVVKDEMVDNIIKDGFHEHNRLHIASLAMAGLLANQQFYNHRLRSYGCGPIETMSEDGANAAIAISLNLADALISKCKKGGIV